MSRLKNLYTHLITNRRAEVDGWLERYLEFTNDVAAIRGALEQGNSIRDNSCYEKTAFKNSQQPWAAFLRRLIYDQENGVSSRGQSVLSEKTWDSFKTTNLSPPL